MARNDIVLVDSLLDQLEQANPSPSLERGQIYERFVLEQVLKNYDLSTEELDFGFTDGSLDGGIDGFYILINGRLLTDINDFFWPRTSAEIEIYIFTCKLAASFTQAPLDSLLATIQDIFDLRKELSELNGKYSQKIKISRELFVSAYRKLSISRPTVSFTTVHACRGDVELIGETITARSNQLNSLFTSYFSAAKSTYLPIGASELIELHRQIKNFELDLNIQEHLTAGQDGYVVLSTLHDYANFVKDENGQLRRYLFDSNVRSYLGQNSVNTDILKTLEDPSSPNFWWLNNGVTILATSATLVGKILRLKGIQIVNGLQTTESIHKHFSCPDTTTNSNRALLVKVIASANESIHDQVIRATNNQSSVEPAALHATDTIQRNIEEILLRHEWYYERRTNHFKNEGRPESRIIPPLTIATGSVAILLKNPLRSSKFRQKFLRPKENYDTVFSETYPIETWPVIAALMRTAEISLIKFKRVTNSLRGNYLSTWRGPIAYAMAVRLTGTFSFTHKMIGEIDQNLINEDLGTTLLTDIFNSYDRHFSSRFKSEDLISLHKALANTYNTEGNPGDGKREFTTLIYEKKPRRPSKFSKLILELLPNTPWPEDIVHVISKSTGATEETVRRVIQDLIDSGKVEGHSSSIKRNPTTLPQKQGSELAPQESNK